MTLVYDDDIAGFVLSAFYFLLLAIGIILNGFIVIVNLNCWKKSQPLQTIDIIITSLAMMRIILLILYILYALDFLFNKSIIQIALSPEDNLTLVMSAEFCNLWWGSVLCVFYCVKITNYNIRLCTRLKVNVSKMVPWMLLISLLPSILSCLPYHWIMFNAGSYNGTDGHTGVNDSNWFNDFIIYFSGSIIPLVTFCISIGLLMVSLLRHTRILYSRGSGFSDAQREIHLNVIGNIVCFLSLYVLSFLGSILISMSLQEIKPLSLLCALCYTALPSLHSISLIVSNRKLKDALLDLLRSSWIKKIQKPKNSHHI